MEDGAGDGAGSHGAPGSAGAAQWPDLRRPAPVAPAAAAAEAAAAAGGGLVGAAIRGGGGGFVQSAPMAIRRMHIDHESPDEELIKCVVVGDSGVGKTKLVCARACGTSYTLPALMQIHVPTVWAIDHYATDEEVFGRSLSIIDGVRVSLRLWDTFGYHDKDRRFAYGRANVVLLCFSLVRPASLKNAQELWYPEICKCCPGVPVILVGCQADLRYLYSYKSFIELDKGPFFRQIAESDLISPDSGRAAARALGSLAYYETSVLTGFGVKAVFDNAIRAALLRKASTSLVHNLKGVRQPTPQAPQMPPKPDPPDVSCSLAEDSARLYADLSKLLLLPSECFSDVAFLSQHLQLHCHRVVLAAGCTWMRGLFGALDEALDRAESTCELSLPAGYGAAFKSAACVRADESSRRGHVLVLSLRDSVSSASFRCLVRFLYEGQTCDLADSASLASQLGIEEIVKLHAELLLQMRAVAVDDERRDTGDGVQVTNAAKTLSIEYLRRRSQRMKEFITDLDLYTDVSLRMADGDLRAHRCILAARSDVMRAMLQGAFKEGATQTISLSDVTASTGSALLELLYTGDCTELKPCGLVELLTLANRLCLPHVLVRVEWMCVRKLAELEATGEDIVPLVLSIMELAQLHNAGRLAEWCQYHVSINYHYCFTHHLRDLKELSPENRATVARNRWPPLWFLRETGEYLKLVRNSSRKENERADSCEDHHGGAALLTAGCLCFSSKMRSITGE